MRHGRRLSFGVAAAFLVAILLASMAPGARAVAQTSPIKITSKSITSEFPDGFRLTLEAEGTHEITEAAARLRIGHRTQGSYEYFEGPEEADFKPGKKITAELFWRTNTAARYIPPETMIRYSFELEDKEGNKLATEQADFVYRDARFEWNEVTGGSVTVAYHGPVKTRAESIHDAIIRTLAVMNPLLGTDSDASIRVAMYNNEKEMLEAYPPASATIRRELITEGQAWADEGTLLTLGGGRSALGTASHEVTHIIVHRAGDSIFRGVPSWLNEGLAEFGNVAPTYTYSIALEFAAANGRLMPVMYMQGLPGDPEDAIIFYGQARSIVRLMVRRFGGEKMRELMASLKEGKDMDNALTLAYGVDRLGLTNMWREGIDAPLYELPDADKARPTPVSQRAVQLFSLTPQAGTDAIQSVSAEATPTRTPEPTVTPEAMAAIAEEQATPKPEPTEAEKPQDEPATGSTGCAAPINGGALDLSAAVFVLGLVGLRMRKKKG